ncbi:MAG: hypothetical protein ABS62_08565 [Microbacterium sp. SCN 70-200]|uniref:hypothetical protein n=1 Tax=unclassified Microbacterium TaxID=2609290 RepID=UPI00086A2872|nr:MULTISPECIES: hypothetical protein [unclassified Microbacterium]MBN9214371.1 hypothetical protein [Microbacterium sp.]ODT41005.1 MAG: hypothetical protein ABS62_08565 [Microbacterium sp. SCN 70-200]OJV83824.1 MAG: hypothetical protein BGO46_12555 [Microbacterium sp. 70-16]
MSAVVCSRAGCRADAAWQVIWRNPRIHTPDRRKIWAACDEHVTYLRDYLAARDFPVEVAALPDIARAEADS